MKKSICFLILVFCFCSSEKIPTEPEALRLARPTQIVGELMIGTKESGIKLGWSPSGGKPMITLYEDGEERVQIASDFIHFKKDGRCIYEIRPERGAITHFEN